MTDNIVKLIGEIQLMLKSNSIGKITKDVEKALSGVEVDINPNVKDNSKGGKKDSFLSGAFNIASKGIGSIGKTLGKILKGAAIVIGVAGAVSGILRVFESVSNMLDAVFKMMGEFLRPIARSIMMVINPVLQMLKPILMIFKQLMKPFEEAANVGVRAGMQLMAMGQQQILAGDEEAGKSLMAEGFKAQASAASLLMSGFVESVFTPVMNATPWGDKFGESMDTWQDSAITGVMRGNMLVGVINDLSGSFLDLPEAIQYGLDGIDAMVETLRLSVGEFDIDDFSDDLETAQGVMLTASADIQRLTAETEEEKLAAEKAIAEAIEATGGMAGTYAANLHMFADEASILAGNVLEAAEAFGLLNTELQKQAILSSVEHVAGEPPTAWDKTKSFVKGGASAQSSFIKDHPILGTAGNIMTGGMLSMGVGIAGGMKGVKTDEKDYEERLEGMQIKAAEELAKLDEDTTSKYINIGKTVETFNTNSSKGFSTAFGSEGTIPTSFSQATTGMTTGMGEVTTAVEVFGNSARSALSLARSYASEVISLRDKIDSDKENRQSRSGT